MVVAGSAGSPASVIAALLPFTFGRATFLPEADGLHVAALVDAGVRAALAVQAFVARLTFTAIPSAPVIAPALQVPANRIAYALALFAMMTVGTQHIAARRPGRFSLASRGHGQQP